MHEKGEDRAEEDPDSSPVPPLLPERDALMPRVGPCCRSCLADHPGPGHRRRPRRRSRSELRDLAREPGAPPGPPVPTRREMYDLRRLPELEAVLLHHFGVRMRQLLREGGLLPATVSAAE